MADNVQITEGTGKSVATDDVGGIHYQKIKIISGTDNETTGCPVDSSYGLAVDVKRAAASNVTVTADPVIDRATDNIGVAQQTDAIMNDTTALTPAFAAIDAASSGDNTVIAAVTGKKLRVVSCLLMAAGTVNVRFESGAGGTALTGQMNLVANTGFSLPFNPVGWFETGEGALLNLELSAAISVDGCLTYVEI